MISGEGIMDKLKHNIGIVFYTLSSIAVLLAGLNWIIGMHINPLSEKIDNLINNDIKHMNERIDKVEHNMNARFDTVNARFDKMNERFDKLYQILLKDKQNSK